MKVDPQINVKTSSPNSKTILKLSTDDNAKEIDASLITMLNYNVSLYHNVNVKQQK